MAVVIKGMEMPTSCVHCNLKRRMEYGKGEGDDTGFECPFIGRIDDGKLNVPRTKRADGCPLDEVPELSKLDAEQLRILEEAGLE